MSTASLQANWTQLNRLSCAALEEMKAQLEATRDQIIMLQNARSPLFRIPGEIRNRIFSFAMQADLADRKQRVKHCALFREPAFFATSRQIRSECLGVWFHEILIWEEFIVGESCTDSRHVSEEKADVSMIEGVSEYNISSRPGTEDLLEALRSWKTLNANNVRELCLHRAKTGKLALTTQRAYCDLGRLRKDIQGSRSSCPRKGLATVRGWDSGYPSLRWWMW